MPVSSAWRAAPAPSSLLEPGLSLLAERERDNNPTTALPFVREWDGPQLLQDHCPLSGSGMVPQALPSVREWYGPFVKGWNGPTKPEASLLFVREWHDRHTVHMLFVREWHGHHTVIPCTVVCSLLGSSTVTIPCTVRDSYRGGGGGGGGGERGDSPPPPPPLLNQHNNNNMVVLKHKQQQSDKCCSKKVCNLFKDTYNFSKGVF